MQAGFEPWIFRSRGGRLNHKANDAVRQGLKQAPLIVKVQTTFTSFKQTTKQKKSKERKTYKKDTMICYRRFGHSSDNLYKDLL